MGIWWYLLVTNLLLRTFYAMFFIPYLALGFEMCTDYTGRTKLQGIRTALNMLTNLLGPALSWTIFFSQTNSQKIAGIDPNSIPQNYINMGTGFSIVSFLFVLYCCFSTYKYKEDTKNMLFANKTVTDFFANIINIFKNKHAMIVYSYSVIAILGIAIVSVLQMYCYVHFLKAEAVTKTLIHGGTMVGMGLGGLCTQYFVKRFNKKGTAKIAVIWNVMCNLVLAVLFLPGILKPICCILIGNFQFPLGLVVFAFFHDAFWFANGLFLTVSASMTADISEIDELKTGMNKDGSYSAVYTFFLKCAMSLAVLIAGYLLSAIGISGKTGIGSTYSETVVWRLGAATILLGPVIAMFSLIPVKLYSITNEYMQNLRIESKMRREIN
jgi:GPH family glycoside/pentoside/hexuronide:cation symporter